MGFTYKNSTLHCGEVALEAIVRETGTPVYVYDFAAVRTQVEALRAALKVPHLLAFSVKSNGNLSLLRHLKSLGCGFDIVSGGELFRVLRAGGEAAQVVFSGVGKSRDEMQQALEAGVGWIAAESAAELETLAQIATSRRQKVRVLLRINPEIDPKTHPYIATGIKESKFGIAPAEGRALFKKYSAASGGGAGMLELIGISFHIGSQILEAGPFSTLCSFAAEFIGQLRADGHTITTLDLGGGVGIQYDAEQTLPISTYGEFVNRHIAPLGLQHFIVEPGRFIVGNAGVLVSRVINHKRNGDKEFRILDAGMGDLIRPALYKAFHKLIPVAQPPAGAPLKQLDWVGPICESGDFLAKERPSHDVAADGLVALLSAGAYGAVMASNYNARRRPAEVAVDGKQWRLVRRRERYEDLVRDEEGL